MKRWQPCSDAHAALEGVVEERESRRRSTIGESKPGHEPAAGIDLEQAVRQDGLAPPFEGERVERLGPDRVPCEPERLLPDEDLAGGRRTPSSRSAMFTASPLTKVVAGRTAGDDFAAVDADAHVDADADSTLELVVQRPERLA